MDSLTEPVISKELQELVQALLGPNFQGISNIPVQQQMNASDCGVFAIAYATCLVYGQNPCTVLCKSNESEMGEFRSLSSRLFKENSPENSGVFSQCLEGYVFKTKEENSPHFRDQNENSLPEE